MTLKATREAVLEKLAVCISQAPELTQLALADALETFRKSRDLNRILKGQPVARMLLDAIDDGLCEAHVQRAMEREEAATD